MKTLLIPSAAMLVMLVTGCETSEPTETTSQPANQTGSQPVEYKMTPSEKRVMQLQELDRQYSEGAMTPGDYQMRQEQIIGQY